jgi:hypothetical protein
VLSRQIAQHESFPNSCSAKPVSGQQTVAAPDVGLPLERVREILFGVDSGHNGLTVAKTADALKREFGGTG